MAKPTHIEDLRREIADMLPSIKDEDLLTEVRQLLSGESQWDEEAELESIHATEEDIQNNRLISHKEAMQEARKWIQR